MGGTSPDANLYSDYYLDDLLTESALEETSSYFAELMRCNLPASDIVSSDFAMLNDRLASHYGLPPVQGVAVTKNANGTTFSYQLTNVASRVFPTAMYYFPFYQGEITNSKGTLQQNPGY